MKEINRSSIVYIWKGSGKATKFSFIDDGNFEVVNVDWKFTLFNIFSNPKLSIQTNPYLKNIFLVLINFIGNIKNSLFSYPRWCAYKRKIEYIILKKELVLSIPHGGLGDWLVYSPLPEMLYNKYQIQTYISKSSLENLRNKDIHKLFFETNPYIKGVRDSDDFSEINYQFEYFSYEKKLKTFIFDLEQQNWAEIIFNQFHVLNKTVKPKIFFVPKINNEYINKIIVDINYISGKKLGWYYNHQRIKEVIMECSKRYKVSEIIYIDPKAQNLETYFSMVYSCKHFITVLSGGAALAASLDKEFTVILPENISGGSVDGFIFKNSKGNYIR